MDPITQGLLGAALPVAIFQKPSRLRVAALGALSGMAPDLDILIRSAHDPMVALTFHRHFTHALAFIPVGGLICAMLLRRLAPRDMPFAHTVLICILGWGTHGLLDACTSYGTQLFWPWSDVRVAWNIVSVVDPIFSGMLLAGLILCHRHKAAPAVALILCVGYLGFGVFQRDRAVAAARETLARTGEAVTRITAHPSFGNTLVWRTLADTPAGWRINAYRVLGDIQRCGTTLAPKMPAHPVPPGTRQARDLARFAWFSNGYTTPMAGGHVGDVRYAMIPSDNAPLWSIGLDPDNPEAAVAWGTYRGITARNRDRFLAILGGDATVCGAR